MTRLKNYSYLIVDQKDLSVVSILCIIFMKSDTCANNISSITYSLKNKSQ